MNVLMPSEPSPSKVPAGQVIVEPVPSVQSNGHVASMYAVKPAVDDEPLTRCTTLMGSDGSVTSVLSALMSSWSHVVICPLKIFASSQAVRCTDAPPTGAEWNTPMPPSANGTCTIARLAATTALYRSADIGMSPAPKWLSALLPLLAPRNSFWPVLEPTARYVACTGNLARAVIRPSSSQKSFDGFVVPAPCSICTWLASRPIILSSVFCTTPKASKIATPEMLAEAANTPTTDSCFSICASIRSRSHSP